MKVFTPEQKLDSVLNLLSETKHTINIKGSSVNALDIGEIGIFINKSEQTISENEIYLIIDKLYKDEYISYYETNNKVDKLFAAYVLDRNYYYITFEGRVFLKEGGYVQKEKDKILERAVYESEFNRRKWIDRLIVFGTIFAGLGASALVIWEMYKYFYLEHH